MKILVIGSGGREHALAWKLSHSPRVEAIYVAPGRSSCLESFRMRRANFFAGNGGTARGLKNVSNVDIGVGDFPSLVGFAVKTGIDLVVPGPEAPLVDGIEGQFRKGISPLSFFTRARVIANRWTGKVGIPCFGPSKEAARMEGSKAYSKDFMRRHNIPTAEYRNFSVYEEARGYLEKAEHNVVIKASGLAAGKGVIIPKSKEEALIALKEIMVDKEFGAAGWFNQCPSVTAHSS